AERPHGRPGDTRIVIERQRHRLRHLAARVPLRALAILTVAEPHARVRVDGGGAELRATNRAPRLIALKDPGVALERLAERAGARLRVTRALAARAGS